MGFRINKKINLGKAFKLNVGKQGLSVTYQPMEGVSYNINTVGRIRRTISLHGTGISHVKETRLFKKDKSKKNSKTDKKSSE